MPLLLGIKPTPCNAHSWIANLQIQNLLLPSGGWNTNFIQSSFDDTLAAAILNTLVPHLSWDSNSYYFGGFPLVVNSLSKVPVRIWSDLLLVPRIRSWTGLGNIFGRPNSTFAISFSGGE